MFYFPRALCIFMLLDILHLNIDDDLLDEIPENYVR